MSKDVSPTSRTRRGPPLKLEISVPSAAPAPSSPYAFTPSGSFTEDDLRINKSGLKIGKAGAGSSKSPSPPGSGNNREEGGLRLEDFEDLELSLGSGAGGYVRKFRHKTTNEVMAMKIIQLDVSEDIRRKILMELRTLHRSSHDSIVSFYDAFYSEGCIYIALEFMDSGNLADVLKRVGKIPEPILAKITLRLLRGVEYIHKELRVVHRDIKPSNLLLNSKGEVKITDFGVSGKLANTIAKAQTFVGTVTYMSPERIRAQNHASNSDIWSLGLTILECAVGYYPYRPPPPVSSSSSSSPSSAASIAASPTTTFFELLEDIQTNPSPTLPEEGFTKEFRDFIDACLQKDPNVRPNASELLEHPFMKKYETEAIDVAGWLHSASTR